MTHHDDELDARIVDTAMAMAEDVGWEGVRLRTVAETLGITLDDLGHRFRDLDAVADAWFARAQQAMLTPPEPGFADQPARERLKATLLRWFDALAPRRQVTVQMLKAKAWPFHPHHWVPMVFNLSRTIQWLRDAASLDADSPRREVEEIGLTWLFVATLAVWAGDETAGQQRTRRFLDARLREADGLMATLFGRVQAGEAD